MPIELAGSQEQKEPSIQEEATAGKENIIFEEIDCGRIWRKCLCWKFTGNFSEALSQI